MALTSELNLMDLLFDKDDSSLNLESLDKEDLTLKTELIDIDSKPSFGIASEVWPSNPDDFLDSLLSLNDNPFEESLLAEGDIPYDVLDNTCDIKPNLSPAPAVVSSSSSDSGMNSDVQSDVFGDQLSHDVAEDSGVSVDLQMSPLLEDVEEDVDIASVDSIPESPVTDTSIDSAQFSLLDSAVLNSGVLDTSSIGQLQLKNNTAIINMNLMPAADEASIAEHRADLSAQQLTLRPVKTWKRSNTSNASATLRQMIRVTPMPVAGSASSSHPRSILLPLQDLKDVRTIKIVNANNTISKRTRCRPMVPAVGKSTPLTVYQVKSGTVVSSSVASPPQSSSISSSDVSEFIHFSGDDSSDDSSDNTIHGQNHNPRVILSAEEKRLMEKEGVTLPSHYPLTKQEERELKRIRRKIRNKISAQDSRKRKKEYVDGLEDRVKQCTDENRELLKRLKVLQSQNESLATQLHRLRALVARSMAGGTSRAAQPATCLMVLLLSLALVMVPNLRPGNNTVEDQELSSANSAMNVDNKLPAYPGRSRALLHSTTGAPFFVADSTEDIDILDEEETKLSSQLLGKRRAAKNSLLDHDYSPTNKKLSRFSIEPGVGQFIDPAIDDTWPPPSKQSEAFIHLDDRIETMVDNLLNNKTEEPSSTLILPISQEER